MLTICTEENVNMNKVTATLNDGTAVNIWLFTSAWFV